MHLFKGNSVIYDWTLRIEKKKEEKDERYSKPRPYVDEASTLPLRAVLQPKPVYELSLL